MNRRMVNGKRLRVGGKTVINDDCCCHEMIEGNCCGDDCNEMPKYLSVTISGVTNCGEWSQHGVACDCETWVNTTFICEWDKLCYWEWAGDYCRETALPLWVWPRVQVTMNAAGGLRVLATIMAEVGLGGPGMYCRPCFDGTVTGLDYTDCDVCDNMPETGIVNDGTEDNCDDHPCSCAAASVGYGGEASVSK